MPEETFFPRSGRIDVLLTILLTGGVYDNFAMGCHACLIVVNAGGENISCGRFLSRKSYSVTYRPAHANAPASVRIFCRSCGKGRGSVGTSHVSILAKLCNNRLFMEYRSIGVVEIHHDYSTTPILSKELT